MVLGVPAVSQAVQAQSHPVVRIGDHGPAVKTAETTLHKLGYYHGSIDSVFGPELLYAVKSFQGHYGLAQDGIVGALTWGKLSAATGTPATHSSASPNFSAAPPTLRLGSKGPAVKHVQILLNHNGYHVAVDGRYGPMTYSAVRTFQAHHGLRVDGIAGPNTIDALEHRGSNTASQKMEAAPPKSSNVLKEGDAGPAVKTLQQDLHKLGYSTGGIDGHFGPSTLRAVELFQHSSGLRDNGVVGPVTWKALHQALGETGSTSAAPLSNRGSVSSTASAIVGLAMKYDGYRYWFGGNNPSTGFDCSGFVQWVYAQVGISLPRTSFSQWNVGTHVTESQLVPGDLVFFTTDGIFANHVGIYLGNGEFISAASPGQGVTIQSLDSPYFAQAFDGAVQVVQ